MATVVPVSLHVLEQQGRAACLDGPIGYLRDLEIRADLGRNAAEVATLLQEVEECSESP